MFSIRREFNLEVQRQWWFRVSHNLSEPGAVATGPGLNPWLLARERCAMVQTG